MVNIIDERFITLKEAKKGITRVATAEDLSIPFEKIIEIFREGKTIVTERALQHFDLDTLKERGYEIIGSNKLGAESKTATPRRLRQGEDPEMAKKRVDEESKIISLIEELESRGGFEKLLARVIENARFIKTGAEWEEKRIEEKRKIVNSDNSLSIQTKKEELKKLDYREKNFSLKEDENLLKIGKVRLKTLMSNAVSHVDSLRGTKEKPITPGEYDELKRITGLLESSSGEKALLFSTLIAELERLGYPLATFKKKESPKVEEKPKEMVNAEAQTDLTGEVKKEEKPKDMVNAESQTDLTEKKSTEVQTENTGSTTSVSTDTLGLNVGSSVSTDTTDLTEQKSTEVQTENVDITEIEKISIGIQTDPIEEIKTDTENPSPQKDDEGDYKYLEIKFEKYSANPDGTSGLGPDSAYYINEKGVKKYINFRSTANGSDGRTPLGQLLKGNGTDGDQYLFAGSTLMAADGKTPSGVVLSYGTMQVQIYFDNKVLDKYIKPDGSVDYKLVHKDYIDGNLDKCGIIARDSRYPDEHTVSFINCEHEGLAVNVSDTTGNRQIVYKNPAKNNGKIEVDPYAHTWNEATKKFDRTTTKVEELEAAEKRGFNGLVIVGKANDPDTLTKFDFDADGRYKQNLNNLKNAVEKYERDIHFLMNRHKAAIAPSYKDLSIEELDKLFADIKNEEIFNDDGRLKEKYEVVRSFPGFKDIEDLSRSGFFLRSNQVEDVLDMHIKRMDTLSENVHVVDSIDIGSYAANEGKDKVAVGEAISGIANLYRGKFNIAESATGVQMHTFPFVFKEHVVSVTLLRDVDNNKERLIVVDSMSGKNSEKEEAIKKFSNLILGKGEDDPLDTLYVTMGHQHGNACGIYAAMYSATISGIVSDNSEDFSLNDLMQVGNEDALRNRIANKLDQAGGQAWDVSEGRKEDALTLIETKLPGIIKLRKEQLVQEELEKEFMPKLLESEDIEFASIVNYTDPSLDVAPTGVCRALVIKLPEGKRKEDFYSKAEVDPNVGSATAMLFGSGGAVHTFKNVYKKNGEKTEEKVSDIENESMVFLPLGRIDSANEVKNSLAKYNFLIGGKKLGRRNSFSGRSDAGLRILPINTRPCGRGF